VQVGNNIKMDLKEISTNIVNAAVRDFGENRTE
jgi:hypothetical protein